MPAGPVFPVLPGGPAGPVLPGWPVLPRGPAGPVFPAGPCGPGMPVVPDALLNPTNANRMIDAMMKITAMIIRRVALIVPSGSFIL